MTFLPTKTSGRRWDALFCCFPIVSSKGWGKNKRRTILLIFFEFSSSLPSTNTFFYFINLQEKVGGHPPLKRIIHLMLFQLSWAARSVGVCWHPSQSSGYKFILKQFEVIANFGQENITSLQVLNFSCTLPGAGWFPRREVSCAT